MVVDQPRDGFGMVGVDLNGLPQQSRRWRPVLVRRRVRDGVNDGDEDDDQHHRPADHPERAHGAAHRLAPWPQHASFAPMESTSLVQVMAGASSPDWSHRVTSPPSRFWNETIKTGQHLQFGYGGHRRAGHGKSGDGLADIGLTPAKAADLTARTPAVTRAHATLLAERPRRGGSGPFAPRHENATASRIATPYKNYTRGWQISYARPPEVNGMASCPPHETELYHAGR